MVHTLVLSVTSPTGNKSSSLQLTGAAILELDESFAASGTNVPLALAIDISQVKSIFILSDQDVTLKTNSSGSPTDTLALKANQPYIWFTNAYDTCKITADVTTAFVTNATADTANLSIRVLFDPTP